MGALDLSCILARLCSHSRNVCMPLGRSAWCLGLVRVMSRVLVVGMVIQDVSRAVPVSANQHRPQGRGALVDPLSSPDLRNIHAVGLVVRVVCWGLQTTEPVMSCGATTGEGSGRRCRCTQGPRVTHQTSSSSSISSSVTLEELAAGLESASSAECEYC